MYWHDRVFKEAQTVTRDADTTFELPENVPIGSLFLEMTCKKTAGNPMGAINKWRLLDYIDGITMMGDGTTKLCNVSAEILAAFNQFDQGGNGQGQFREYSQDTDRVWLMLNFGRHFHDPEMYIPANRFDSIDLTISFNATSTYFQENIAMDILIAQPSGVGVPASKGFLVKERWREWTTVADEWKYLKLPKENVIRRVLLQAVPNVDANYVESTNLFNLMDEIKLRLQNGDLEVYHNGLSYLARLNSFQYGGPFRAGGWIYHTADKGFNCGLGYVYRIVGTSGSRDGAASATIPTPEGDRNSFTQKMETYEADSPFAFEAVGLAPECCVVYPFDEDPDPITWLNPDTEGTVHLDIHTRNASSAADGKNKVVLDYLRY